MSHAPQPASGLFGLLAEFESAEALLAAAHDVHAAGFTKTDAYSPFPIHGLAEAIGFRDRRISRFVLIGGITGCLGGFAMQYWMQVIDFPINIGGRPEFAWVSFIPPTFELTILFAAFTAGISMVVLNGLPLPYHPVFHAPRFSRASSDGFFLSIEAADPKFDLDRTRTFLEGLGARDVVALDE
jgi:hypothetical protein